MLNSRAHARTHRQWKVANCGEYVSLKTRRSTKIGPVISFNLDICLLGDKNAPGEDHISKLRSCLYELFHTVNNNGIVQTFITLWKLSSFNDIVNRRPFCVSNSRARSQLTCADTWVMTLLSSLVQCAIPWIPISNERPSYKIVH